MRINQGLLNQVMTVYLLDGEHQHNGMSVAMKAGPNIQEEPCDGNVHVNDQHSGSCID